MHVYYDFYFYFIEKGTVSGGAKGSVKGRAACQNFLFQKRLSFADACEFHPDVPHHCIFFVFFITGIKKGEADKLLSADGGLETKGKFLIRSKGDSTTDFILSIVYKGAATHHALVRDGEGSEFKLNKQPTGTTTHAELIEKYVGCFLFLLFFKVG